MYVTPPSSEYWNLLTATSSVADRFSVCGAVMRQLLLPFGGAANEGAARTGATVSAAIAGEAATSDADPTARPSRILGRNKPFTDIPLPSRLDAQARASCSNVSPGHDRA